MLKVYKCGGAIVAAGGALDASQIFKIFDNTDNPTYNNSDTPPQTEQLLESIFVSSDAPCEVQFGFTDAGKDAFTPIWGTLATMVAPSAGGNTLRKFWVDRPRCLFSATNIPAFRIIVSSNATVHIEGDLDLAPRVLI